MSAPRYAVETVGTTVCVLAENEQFSAPIIQSLQKEGIEVVEFDSKSNTPLICDIALVFLTPNLAKHFVGEGINLWQKLCSVGSHKLVILERSWQKSPLTLPDNALHIRLGEYLGLDGEGSPTLIRISNEIATSHTITLGSGGIVDFSIMSQEYLASATAKILANLPSSPQLYLSNPDTTSLLNLCQNLHHDLKNPITLKYDEEGIMPIRVLSTQSEAMHKLQNLLTAESSQALAIDYLSNLPDPIASVTTSSPSLSPKAPVTGSDYSVSASNDSLISRSNPPIPHISPLTPITPRPPRNLSNLEFVPLKTPKRRLAAKTKLKLKGLRIFSKGMLLGIIFYLGSLALALGITYVTLQSLSTKLSSFDTNNLPINFVAKLSGRYLYSNSVAWGWSDATLLLDAYNQALRLGETAISLSSDAQSIAAYILGDSGGNLAGNLSSARLSTEDLYQQVSLLDGTLPPSTPTLLSRYDSTYQTLKQSFPTIKKHLLLGKGVFSVLPEVIGLGTRAKYAVLFQNNMELRGTGGFIGSFAILSFENGKLYDLTVHDVYAADGQLKGHVEPPAPIKDVLGEAKWYLRDSNFDPDFPTSARRAEWFLKKSMNLDVAGTAAINLETLKGLLTAVGPLTLPDYNETVNAENLTERAQYHAEVNFFPGSTAKKEFLSSVADALFAKLKEGGEGNLLGTIIALTSSLESNDLQLSSLNKTTESVLQTLGWNGQIENKPCPTSPCYSDFIYSVDSNFGVNKANFYVTKSTTLNIAVSKEGQLNNSLTTTWDNKATSNAWPAGSYKNYTRTYLPNNVTLVELKVGDHVLSPSDYSVTSEHGHLVVSYLVTIPTSSKLSSTLTYTNATPLKSGTLYSLYYQKQSGVNAHDPIKVSISYPLYLKPTQISPAAELLPQQLNFNFVSDTDHRISIQF